MTRLPSSLARAVLLVSGLAGCQFGGPRMNPDDREAMSDCRQETDRTFAVRNRYELSERDSRDTPFSSNQLPYNPGAGLRDQYEREQLLDDCLAHSAAGDAAISGTSAIPPVR